jgi:hypothetical protein
MHYKRSYFVEIESTVFRWKFLPFIFCSNHYSAW